MKESIAQGGTGNLGRPAAHSTISTISDVLRSRRRSARPADRDRRPCRRDAAGRGRFEIRYDCDGGARVSPCEVIGLRGGTARSAMPFGNLRRCFGTRVARPMCGGLPGSVSPQPGLAGAGGRCARAPGGWRPAPSRKAAWPIRFGRAAGGFMPRRRVGGPLELVCAGPSYLRHLLAGRQPHGHFRGIGVWANPSPCRCWRAITVADFLSR